MYLKIEGGQQFVSEVQNHSTASDSKQPQFPLANLFPLA
jgi:hypothetical protein